jgi:hypothetical protein
LPKLQNRHEEDISVIAETPPQNILIVILCDDGKAIKDMYANKGMP